MNVSTRGALYASHVPNSSGKRVREPLDLSTSFSRNSQNPCRWLGYLLLDLGFCYGTVANSAVSCFSDFPAGMGVSIYQAW